MTPPSRRGARESHLQQHPMQPNLFTIGHSNHSEETFLGLLRAHLVQVLVDVRSQPYSGYSTHFNYEPLRQAMAAAGIKYLFLGRELGGRPDGDDFYDDEGHVLYGKVAASDLFQAGIQRLEKGISDYRIAIMCSEENPAVCHRQLLVSRVLRKRGVNVLHIRGDGHLETDEEIVARAGSDVHQPLLFGEMETDSWRSIRSVLRK